MKKTRNKDLTGDYGGGVIYKQSLVVIDRSPRGREEWRVKMFETKRIELKIRKTNNKTRKS